MAQPGEEKCCGHTCISQGFGQWKRTANGAGIVLMFSLVRIAVIASTGPIAAAIAFSSPISIKDVVVVQHNAVLSVLIVVVTAGYTTILAAELQLISDFGQLNRR